MSITALLFYQKLMKDLEAICFKVNAYYSCVDNKMICDKQIIITSYVKDLKVSHTEKAIFDAFFKWSM